MANFIKKSTCLYPKNISKLTFNRSLKINYNRFDFSPIHNNPKDEENISLDFRYETF